MTHSNFLPKKEAELTIFLASYLSGLTANRTTLALTTGDTASQTTYCNGISTAINNVSIQKANQKNATASKNTTKKANLLAIQNFIQLVKKLPNYTTAIGNALGVIGAANPFDPSTFKTVLTTDAFPGYVLVKYHKGDADGINLYARLQGVTNWTLVSRVNTSPYADTRPLALSGTPEIRQYMAIGVMSDTEIGLQSDISTVVYGG